MPIDLQDLWTCVEDGHGDTPLCDVRPLSAAISSAAETLGLTTVVLRAHMKAVLDLPPCAHVYIRTDTCMVHTPMYSAHIAYAGMPEVP